MRLPQSEKHCSTDAVGLSAMAVTGECDEKVAILERSYFSPSYC